MNEAVAIDGLPGLDDVLLRVKGVSSHCSGPALTLKETGRLISVGHGIARATGLPRAELDELVLLPDQGHGIVFNLDPEEVGIMLLSSEQGLTAGMWVERTGRTVEAPVGPGALGRALSPLGHPLDGGERLSSGPVLPVEREAPGIMARAPVTVPLQTGVKVIDGMIPIGRGQRQLILGDRQTGKTTLAIQAILNQKSSGVYCIYCGVGQRATALAHVINMLKEHDAIHYSSVIGTTEADPPGLQVIAPFAAMSMAEAFMAQGRDVLLILDDLTRHARAYRELSLLLRRPPGREAFPGDIFYLHSRLLERATHLREELGGGSITALPIMETEGQNISGYISTNLISITDGQVYLSPQLFQKGILPAIDVGRSVSRVGGKTQLPSYRAVVGELRLIYSQFEELEAFTRFGARLDDRAAQTLRRGLRIREVLNQGATETIGVAEQIVAFEVVSHGLLDTVPPQEVMGLERAITRSIRQELPSCCERLDVGHALDPEERQRILDQASRIVSQQGVSEG